jgi:uncharacterized protein (UPF0333 family)
MTVQHKSIPDAQLHEAKGAASASIGQILTATGGGTATFQTPPYTSVKMGHQNYEDTATASTPIALTVANTDYQLTNNALGARTNSTYTISDIGTLWSTSSNIFNFTGLSLGDTVDIRTDIEITTATPNNAVKLVLQLGQGAGTYTLTIGDSYFKNSGVHKVVINTSLFIGDTNTRDNPVKLVANNDTVGSTVKVNGWFIRVIKRV